jgi:pyrroloquinoline quinone biosynthesis protein B
MFKYLILLLGICLLGCRPATDEVDVVPIVQDSVERNAPYIVVLGNVQDAGSPHAGCNKSCCVNLFDNPDPKRMVTSLGLVDPIAKKTFLLEASPDLPRQMKYLKSLSGQDGETPDGIFLTHAHIGHYTGLMFLGRESMNADDVNVYAMPRMVEYLSTNGPWDQLVKINNIELNPIAAEGTIQLTKQLSITPFLVPHRDEYSETVGFRIDGPHRSAIFIPDIDKWYKWDRSIVDLVDSLDVAFLDATFYDAEEINNRNISEIPHPFVIETLALFDKSSAETRSKINFIHLNHTNPLLLHDHPKTTLVLETGYQIALFGKEFEL